MPNKKFVSNRHIVVRSKTTGHAIEFEKDVPTPVPEGMHSEVLERGIVAVEGEEVKVTDQVPTNVVLPPEDGLERSKKVLEVVKAIVKRNNPKDFAGGGHPAASAVTGSLGWHVDQKEVREVWLKHRTEILTKQESEK